MAEFGVAHGGIGSLEAHRETSSNGFEVEVSQSRPADNRFDIRDGKGMIFDDSDVVDGDSVGGPKMSCPLSRSESGASRWSMTAGSPDVSTIALETACVKSRIVFFS